MRPLLLAALALAASGCFSYVPSTSPTPAVGAEVRIELAPTGAEEARRLLGSTVRRVDGRVNSLDDQTLTLSVSGTQDSDGRSTSWAGESVAIPRSAVASVSDRVMNKGRTALASAAGVAGSLLVAAIIKTMGDDSKGGPDPTQPIPAVRP